MLGLLKKKQSPQAALREVIGDYELPTFPTTVMEVLRAIRDPDLELDDVATKVEADPGLVVRVLKTVNSAAFGLARSVDTVGHGLAMLGRGRLESLVLGLAVRDALPTPTTEAFDRSRFWSTAARRATLARRVAAELHPATQAQCFTEALLQDMAVPVLAAARAAEYSQVLDAWHSDGDTCLAALEREAFEWDHGAVGSVMATQWELPARLVDGIGGHHGGEGVDRAVMIVSHLRESEDEPGLERMRVAAGEQGLDPAAFDDLVAEAFAQADELAALLR